MDKFIALDIETTGLEPETNRITCIGVATEIGICQFSLFVDEYKGNGDVSESSLLMSFLDYWEIVKKLNPTIVTYNGIKFDYPFIKERCKYHKLDCTSFSMSNHIDLMLFPKATCGRYVSKDDACRKFADLYVPRKTDGLWTARIYHDSNKHLLTSDDHYLMLQHNAVDLGVTARLYLKLRQFSDFKQFMSNAKIEDPTD